MYNPGIYPDTILILKGTTFEIKTTWKDPDGNPYDVTGFKSALSLEKSGANGCCSNSYDFDETNSISVGGSNGQLNFRLEADEEIDAGFYNLKWLLDTGADVIPYLIASVEVK
jgi:hypothetical protein